MIDYAHKQDNLQSEFEKTEMAIKQNEDLGCPNPQLCEKLANQRTSLVALGYRRFKFTEIVVGSDKENYDEKYNRIMLRLAVEFHERLSSEIKDEISSKLASALRALKSRISRICGINELERRVSLAPEAV